MRIVILTTQLGKGPGGKVVANIISELASQNYKLLVICSECHVNTAVNINLKVVPFKWLFPMKLTKLFIVMFRVTLRHRYWQSYVYRNFKNDVTDFNPDFIYAIGSGGTQVVYNLGLAIAKYSNVRLALHLLDPIPGPKGWENYEIYRKSLIHTFKKSLKEADLITMGNHHMLEYQQRNLKFDILGKSFIVPDPVVNKPIKLSSLSQKYVLTFLGSFYGARKPDRLLEGFSEYNKNNPEAELHIVGTNRINLNHFDVSEDAKKKILFQGFTTNLLEVFERTRVLIDVDADIDEDVFISSKLKEYLSVNRMIVSITGENSPSRQLLSGITKSVIVSDFDKFKISKAIEKAMDTKYDVNLFDDRKSVLAFLNVSRICNEIVKNFERISNKDYGTQ